VTNDEAVARIREVLERFGDDEDGNPVEDMSASDALDEIITILVATK
jgi:hypothetical protein